MSSVPDTKIPAIKNEIICQIQATIFSYVNFCNSVPTGLTVSSTISLHPSLQNAARVIILKHILNHFSARKLFNGSPFHLE